MITTSEFIDEIIDRCIRTAKEEERIHPNFVLSKKGRQVLTGKVKRRMTDSMYPPELLERDIAVILGAYLIGYQYGFDAGKDLKK
jgi:hypothetical protein